MFMNLDHIVFLRYHSIIIVHVKRFVKEKIPRKKIIFEGNRVCLENKGGGISRHEASAFIACMCDSKNNAPPPLRRDRQLKMTKMTKLIKNTKNDKKLIFHQNSRREGNRTPLTVSDTPLFLVR